MTNQFGTSQFSAPSEFVISTGGLMALRPTQVDEKPLLRFTHELVSHPLNF
jgi:hypothetical protein